MLARPAEEGLGFQVHRPASAEAWREKKAWVFGGAALRVTDSHRRFAFRKVTGCRVETEGQAVGRLQVDAEGHMGEEECLIQ